MKKVEKQTADKTKNIKSEAIRTLAVVGFAIVMSIVIKALIFEYVSVEGTSMETTLSSGETLIIYKFGYLFSTPGRGDIVVINLNDEIGYIKRIIGLPGDTVSAENGYVYINDKKLHEPYILQGTTDRLEKPVKVPQSHFFVLGDNRENSYDSRNFGSINIWDIKGKAILSVWPLKMFSIIN